MFTIGLSKRSVCSKKPSAMRPSGNDDAILRWNACVRFLDRHKELQPKTEEIREPVLSE